MAPRSTRKKIRHQATKMLNDCDRMLEHLAMIDILANEQSTYINENMPVLTMFIDQLKQTIEQFRKGL